MRKGIAIFVGVVTMLVIGLLAEKSFAYERYIDGCNTCHGNFTTTTVDKHGSTWPSNLHNVHRNNMLNGVCGACHLGSPSSNNAYTFQSSGATGLPGLGCSGCHGNNYGGAVLGAGLRKHHAGAGVTVCAGCHAGDPTPKPENNKPPYYGLPGVNVLDPLNADGSENWSDDGQGLDNDGNGLYDQNDPAASVMAVTAPATGESVPTGAPYLVTWTAQAGAASYKVMLSIDNGATWSTIATGVTGTSTSWDVPGTIKKNVTKALIKVKAVDGTGKKLAIAKTGTFSIDVMTITAPGTGGTVPQNTVFTITWTKNGTTGVVSSAQVKYSLNKGRTWKNAAGTGTLTSFDWSVPGVPKPKNAKVKVILKDAGGAKVAGAVSGIFTVQ